MSAIELNMKGMFWNFHDEKIPKLSLGFQFDQDLMLKMRKNCCCKCKVNDLYCIREAFKK